MAASKGTLARLLVDEFDFSGETSDFTVTLAIGEEDCTVLTSTAAEFTGVLAAISIDQNGYMNNINQPGSLEEELWNRLGVQGSYVAALIGIDNAGCPAYVLENTFGASMEIAAPATGLLTLNGSWGQGKGGHRGVNAYGGTVNAIGTQPSVDTGAAGAAGGEAYLFVRTIGGVAAGAQIKAQHATTQGGTYTDLGTFTVSAVGAQKLTFSGTVNRWVRLNVTNMGGATSFVLTLIVCSRGVTE